ncbi:hypothetical protein [Brevibacillus choshinensis]|uniref:hypothetical protein n=1 Tax=Brevibacillus choshinensis TaxID=54911 RepID=UPI002E23783F|nr:hypothetical protein [Brevibacillus choshinensis]MED4754252.1 hypothetical protein [Brevibacillus choshinensis]
MMLFVKNFILGENIRVEAMLNSLYDIVHVTDAEGKTIYCTETYEQFIGGKVRAADKEGGLT